LGPGSRPGGRKGKEKKEFTKGWWPKQPGVDRTLPLGRKWHLTHNNKRKIGPRANSTWEVMRLAEETSPERAVVDQPLRVRRVLCTAYKVGGEKKAIESRRGQLG